MYEVGDIYPATVDLVDAAGQAVNPGSVTFTFTLPDGSTLSPAPSNPSTGRYTYDLTITQAGLHRFRAVSTGPATAYTEAFSAADASWPAIIGLAELKNHLNIDATNTEHDEELRDFALAITEVVEHIIGPVVPREVVEVFDGGRRDLTLAQMPVLSVTSVEVNDADVPAGEWRLTDAAVLRRKAGSWPAGRDTVTVTYRVGRTAVPRSAALGAKDLAALNWRPQQGGWHSPFDSGGGDESGQMILGFFVPYRVLQQLKPHEQMDGFA